MSYLTRASSGVLRGFPAAVACLLIAAVPAGAATVIHFQRESLQALEGQLAKHEVHALSFHPSPAPGHVHVSLNNGQHMTVVYTPQQQTLLITRARSLGIPVAVAAAKTKATTKTTHHKLRYIAAGLVIVVIIVVTAVLLIDRRRRINEGDGSARPEPSSSDAG